MKRHLLWIAPSLVVGTFLACSAKTDPPNTADFPATGSGGAGAGNNDSGSGGTFVTTGGTGGGGGSSGGSATSCGAPPDLSQCGGEQYGVEDQPIDMFIMLDQSTSMSDTLPNGHTRWQDVTAAINLYLANGAPSDMHVGLQYFGLGTMDGCVAPTDGGDTDWSKCSACNVAQYNSADVAIAPLATAAPQIVNSIKNHGPSTFTPTAAAVQGGLQFARASANNNPGRKTMFVLVTDGFPTQCAVQDIGGIAAMAETEAMGTPPVITVVVGVGEAASSNLNTIAVRGGSKAAVLVPQNGDATQLIVDGLSKVSHTPLGCKYKLPMSFDGGKVDPDKVNVRFNAKDNTQQVLCELAGSYQCTQFGGGWYYTDTTTKSELVICPESCDNFPAGTLEILAGCPTYVPPQH